MANSMSEPIVFVPCYDVAVAVQYVGFFLLFELSDVIVVNSVLL